MDALRLRSLVVRHGKDYCCHYPATARNNNAEVRAIFSSPPRSISCGPLNLKVSVKDNERRIVKGIVKNHGRKTSRRRSSSGGASRLHVLSQSSSSVEEVEGEVAAASTSSSTSSGIEVETRTWKWRDYNIRYQSAGRDGPALVLIHGFGANCDHWRKNIPELAKSHRVYAIDLLGYGYSDKPDPRNQAPNTLYTFETWAHQVLDFCDEIVKDSVFLICNSVGGVAGLQCAISQPQKVRGILLLNISLRLLHIKKQSRFARPFVKALQNVLKNTNLGQRFFKEVATAASVKKILCECYYDSNTVTDELVDKILKPGLLPGAVDVFLDFICYSGGPLPEELLPQVKCPVLIGWGDKDPWEKVELGRAYGNFSTVEDFIVLPNVGHCPQDEAPHLVNPMVVDFVRRHSS
ncbi:unnamed protein product [Calypogeia fissa]